MFASQLFVSFLAFSALAVSANPAPLEKRASDALGVVNTLQVNTAAVLPEINSLVASGFANPNTIAPLVTSLVDHLNTAHTSLTAIKAVDSSAVSTPDVANAMAPITADITTTLHSAQSSVPGLAELLEDLGLDASLNQVLVGLDNIVAGVLNLVSKLLFDVAELLSALGLTLVLGTLGY